MAEPQDTYDWLLDIIRRLEFALEAGMLTAARREYLTLKREAHDHAWLTGYLDEIRAQLNVLRQDFMPLNPDASPHQPYISLFTDWPDVETDDGDLEPLDVGDTNNDLARGTEENLAGDTRKMRTLGDIRQTPNMEQLTDQQNRLRHRKN